MTSALWNRVREHGSTQKNNKESTHSIEINDSQQTFPTEGAEKAKEKKKANKLAGIKPNRKKMHVDHHFDDLGDDLSGLGIDIALFTADTGLTDASNSDSDEEANALVHNWFGNQTMHAQNVTDLFSSINSLQSSEPEILRLVATSNPEVAMLSVRKYNHVGPMFEASTRLDLANPNQVEVLLNYARTKPFFTAMLETLPRYTPRSSIFNDAAIAMTQVQQAAGKSFVLTQHRHSINHSESHPNLWIKQRNWCQLSFADGTQGFDPTSFRIITNASQIAEKFNNPTCRRNHFHTALNETIEWSPQISEKLALGITELIVEHKRVITKAADLTSRERIHNSFLANPGRAMSDMFKRHVFACHGCQCCHGKFMRTHNRIAGECKRHEVPDAKTRT